MMLNNNSIITSYRKILKNTDFIFYDVLFLYEMYEHEMYINPSTIYLYRDHVGCALERRKIIAA